MGFPTDIEPALPTRELKPLQDLACEILEAAARLSACVRPQLRTEIAEVTRWMHCYYSNLIEGHQTHVRDIEAALHQKFENEPATRDLQRLALAHLAVQKWAATHRGALFDTNFLCELHARFYAALPESLRIATDKDGKKVPLVPGEFRDSVVIVGNHVSPEPELVQSMLKHFRFRYEAPELSRIEKIIAVGASHHRLAWIHPFRDGNGRVVRQFSDAWIRELGIDAGGLWSLSRGLAFFRSDYYQFLALADQPRLSDMDGRGPLSERALRDFCAFVLRTMKDQITYMEQLLDTPTLEARIERYVCNVDPATIPEGLRVFLLLREVLLRGEVERGEAARIVGTRERKAREILALAVQAGLLKSDSPKKSVRLALPSKVLDIYFPRLFPPGA